MSKKIFQEYSQKTTIHGIQFIGDAHRPHCERIWWLIAFITSIVICAMFIKNILDKLNRTPVMVTFADKPSSVLTVPIPALTLCPQNKFNRLYLNVSRIDEMAKTNSLPKTDKWVKIQDIVGQVCSSITELANVEFLETVDYDIEKWLRKLTPNVSNTILQCRAKSEQLNIPCMSVIRESFTSGGLCYTFNGLLPQDLYRNETVYSPFSTISGKTSWSQEDGYKDISIDGNYPHNILGGLFGEVVVLILNQFSYDIEPLCDIFQGFKLLLHSPSDTPLMKEDFIKIPSNSDVRVSVVPTLIKTSKELKQYSPQKRGCVFPSERYLRYFKVYTENNCWIECLSNYTLSRCGCVFFYMPRNINTPVCGIAKNQCAHIARKSLKYETIYQATAENHCGCMPSCTSLSYTAIASQSIESNIQHYYEQFDKQNKIFNLSNMMPIALQLFFKESQFIPIRRQELFNKTDLLASCGGILGLFMGFSVLSFAEIVYYCCVRPSGMYCNNRRKNRVKNLMDAGQSKDSGDKIKIYNINKMDSYMSKQRYF